MSKARWYRGFDNSPDGGLGQKAQGAATRGMNNEYRERQYRDRERDRGNIRDYPKPDNRGPVPYKADPRNQPQRPVPMGPNDYHVGPVIDNDTGKKVRPPRNPFATPPVTRGGLPVTPRRFPKFPRIPGIPWLDIIPIVEPLVFPDNDRNHPPVLPSNYSWCWGPFNWPSKDWGDATYGPAFLWKGQCFTDPGPIDGQVAEDVSWSALPQYGPFAQITQFKEPVAYWWRNYNIPPPIYYRGCAAGTAIRTGPAPAIQPSPYWPIITMHPPPDPNLQRQIPNVPEYDPRVYTPGVTPQLPADPVFAPTPESPYEPDGQWQWDPASFGGSAPATTSPPSTITGEVPFVPIPPVTRAPPVPGERQRKILTRTAKVGIALYKALDAASEAAEVVDAIWDALPKDVKKRWKECKVNRMGDSFGQYGPDQADCKLRALYHNWHRVDVEQAVKNMIKNELQDRVIGGMQSKLPKNSGAAHAEGEKRLAKWLDEYFSMELGL